MDVSPGRAAKAALRRETLAPARTATAEDGATATGAHARAESVDLLPAAIVRLKGTLHRTNLLKKGSIEWFGQSDGVYPTRVRRVNAHLRAAWSLESYVIRSCPEVLRCRTWTPGVHCGPSQTPGAASARQGPAGGYLHFRALRATRFTEALNAVSGSDRRPNISGRNVASACTLRPFRLVDKYVDNTWRGCEDMGMTR